MEFVAPALFAVFAWWFATGIILWLDGLPARTFPYTLAAATAILTISLVALYALRDRDDPLAIYAMFLSVLGVWAWNETTFLLGTLTGPLQGPCPDGAKGMARFRAALDSILYHEAGLILSGTAIAIITWGSVSHFAVHLFALLWVLRLSTKLNLFLGVPHSFGHFLPDQLRYLATYFRTRPVSGFFALSVTAATILAVLLCVNAGDTISGTGARVAASFLAIFAVLGVIEHWFLACPVGADHLWRWAFHGRSDDGPAFPALPPKAIPTVKGVES